MRCHDILQHISGTNMDAIEKILIDGIENLFNDCQPCEPIYTSKYMQWNMKLNLIMFQGWYSKYVFCGSLISLVHNE